MRNYLLPLIQNVYIDFIKTKKEYEKLFVFFLIHSIYIAESKVLLGRDVGQIVFKILVWLRHYYSSLLLIKTTVRSFVFFKSISRNYRVQMLKEIRQFSGRKTY